MEPDQARAGIFEIQDGGPAACEDRLLSRIALYARGIVASSWGRDFDFSPSSLKDNPTRGTGASQRAI